MPTRPTPGGSAAHLSAAVADPLVAVAPRRTLTVLLADVVGYSRQMAQDPETTLRRLEATRRRFGATVRESGGRVHDLTGDAMVAVFDVSAAAAAAALAIQSHGSADADAGLCLRIGLHVDHALVGSDGRLYGNAVNVAARLQEIAEVGGAAASEAFVAALPPALSVHFPPDARYRLKNLPEPTLVHRSVHGVAADERAAGSARLDEEDTGPLSLVVLPLSALGGDAQGEDLADAVTAEVITDLARIPDAFVIARATAMTYRRRQVDPRTACRELNVRFALAGSIVRRNEAFIVDAELISGATGRLLWSERITGSADDLAGLRDRVVGRIARAFGVRLVAEAGARAVRAGDGSLAALRLRALAVSRQAPGPEVVREASALWAQVLQQDPQDPVALSGLAVQRAREVLLYLAADPAAALDDADRLSSRALAIAPFDAELHYNRALVCMVAQRWTAMRTAAERALELDRNFAPALSQRVNGEFMVGLAEGRDIDCATLQGWLDQAIQLSPRDPQLPVWLQQKGALHLLAGDRAQAIASSQQAIDAGDSRYLPWEVMAVAHVELGALDAGRTVIARLCERHPDYTIAMSSQRRPPSSFQSRVETALRAMGVPER